MNEKKLVPPSLFVGVATVWGLLLGMLSWIFVYQYKSVQELRYQLKDLEYFADKREKGESSFQAQSITSPVTRVTAPAPLIPLNRNSEYLQQSMIDFYNKEKLTLLVPHIKKSFNENVFSAETKKMAPKKVIQVSAPFIWPIEKDKFWISSFFGPRRKKDGTVGFHHGIDMAALKGTRVMAADDGIIVEAGFSGGYGNRVVIKHTNTLKTKYAHLDSITVQVGQRVKKGTFLGKVGETGYIRKKSNDGSHLHFEVYEKNTQINPLTLLPPI